MSLDETRQFYESIGKKCVRLRKEVPGHIANRLQAALWREAVHLAVEGIASIKDIDKAVAYGPGLRWGVMGPHSLLHLGGGPGGIRAFCEHLGSSFEDWWDDLGQPRLTEEVIDILAEGVEEMFSNTSMSEMRARRDSLILHSLISDTPGQELT